jgi:hypothetical protein
MRYEEMWARFFHDPIEGCVRPLSEVCDLIAAAFPAHGTGGVAYANRRTIRELTAFAREINAEYVANCRIHWSMR